ncbi:MAG: 50S ribosomal protein L18 [Patescibacteria group bacterium]
MKQKRELRVARTRRIRAKVFGTADRPRMSVFRSNTGLYVQLINDDKRVTLVSSSVAGKTIAAAKQVGTAIAQKAKQRKVTSVVFDRGGYRYHGAIRAIADAAREGGLKI